MITTTSSYDDGVIVETIEYDSVAHTVTTTPPGTSRPMTAEEVEHFGQQDASMAIVVNTSQMVAESGASVDKLVAVVEALNAITDMTNAAINQNPAAVIKTLTRECKTIARQANREARMTSGRAESTDTGPVTDV